MKGSPKFRLSALRTCTSDIAVQPVGFGDSGSNRVRLHGLQRRSETEAYCAPCSARIPRTKSEHTSSDCQRDNGHRDGHTLPYHPLANRRSPNGHDIFVSPLKAQPASRRKTPSSHSTTMAIIPAAIRAIIQSPLRILNFLTALFLPRPGE